MRHGKIYYQYLLQLEEYPLLGVDLGKIIDVPTDYRYLLTEKNYVFYHLEFDKVRVVRVLNEQQDYMMQLFGIRTESIDDYSDSKKEIASAKER